MKKRVFLFIGIMFFMMSSILYFACNEAITYSKVNDNNIVETDDGHNHDRCSHENNELLTRNSTNVIEITKGQIIRVLDRFGTWWNLEGVVEDSYEVTMTYVGGTKQCYLPYGGDFIAEDYNTRTLYKINLSWGNETYAYLSSDCTFYCSDDSDSYYVTGGTFLGYKELNVSNDDINYFKHSCYDFEMYDGAYSCIETSCLYGAYDGREYHCGYCYSDWDEIVSIGEPLEHNIMGGLYDIFSYSTCVNGEGWTLKGNTFTSSKFDFGDCGIFFSAVGDDLVSTLNISFTASNSGKVVFETRIVNDDGYLDIYLDSDFECSDSSSEYNEISINVTSGFHELSFEYVNCESESYALITNLEFVPDVQNGYLNLSEYNGTSTYGKNEKTFSITSSHGGNIIASVTNNSNVNVSVNNNIVTISSLSRINAGTVIKISVICESTSLYTSAQREYILTITKAIPYLSLSSYSGSIEYGDTNAKIVVNIDWSADYLNDEYYGTTELSLIYTVNERDSTLVIQIKDFADINVGTYIIEVGVEESDNYFAHPMTPDGEDAYFEQFYLEISPKKINIPSSPANKTYNGSAQQHGITIPTGASIVTSGSTTSATNAGTYKVIFAVGSNYQWSDSTTTNKTVNWTIVKANITPTVTMNGYTYNGTVSTPSISGNSGSGTVTYYYNTTNSNSGGTVWSGITNTTLNAGTYYMYAVVGATTNYNGKTSSAVAFTISKANGYITISPTTTSVVYGTPSTTFTIVSTHGGELSISSTTSPSTATITGTTVTVSNLGSINAGTKITVEVQCATTTNYDKASATYTLTINRKDISSKDITIALNSSSFTYTGSAITPTITIRDTSRNVNLIVGTDYTPNIGNNINVGNYTITITGQGNYTGDTSKIYSINAKSIASSDISLIWTIDIDKFTYNGSIQKPTISSVVIKDTTRNFTLTNNVDYTYEALYSNGSSINVGNNYTIKISVTGKGNYGNNRDDSKTYSINAKSIALSDIKLSWTISTSVFTYNGLVQKPTITSVTVEDVTRSTVLTNNSDFTYDISYSNSLSTNAGEYTITIIVIGRNNYTGNNTDSKTYTISAKSLTSSDIELSWTISNSSFVYNGSVLKPSISTVTVKDKTRNVTLTSDTDFTYSPKYGNDSSINAGSYSITITIKGNANYKNDLDDNKTYEITKADLLDVLVTMDSYTYGGTKSIPSLSKICDGTKIYYYNLIDSNSNGTEWTTVTSSTSLNVNTYYMYVKITNMTNYNDYVSETYSFRVNNANMTVNSNNYNATYDGEYHSGSVTAMTYGNQKAEIYYSTISVADALNKKNTVLPTFKDVKLVGSEVSQYTVYYYVSALNHNTESGEFSVTINKKALSLTITPDNYETVYSNNVTYPGNYSTTSCDGLVGGDTSEIITITGVASYKFDNETEINQNAGDYVITMDNLSASANNYSITISYGKGKLTINKKSIESIGYVFSKKEVVYNGTKQEIKPEVTINLVTGKSDVSLKEGTDYDLGFDDALNAGDVVVTVTGKGNYTGSVIIEKAYTILKAELTDLASNLTEKKLNVLTLSENDYRLTKLSDISFVTDANEYGYWSLNEEDKDIYSEGNYSYVVKVVFISYSTNYNNYESTLNINLVKNNVEFSLLPTVDATYNMNQIETPSYVIAYSSIYHNTPSVKYYLKGSEIDYIPTNAGTYQYLVELEENEYFNYCKSNFVPIIINAKNVDELSYSEVLDNTFTGFEIKPNVVVKFDSYTLNDNDLTITYSNNIMAYTNILNGNYAIITIVGKGNYTGLYTINFKINPKNITDSMIDSIDDQKYTSFEIEPSVSVNDSSRNTLLTLNTDYRLEYTNNINVSNNTAKAIVKGINNYTGEATKYFNITIGDLEASNVSTVGILSSKVDALLSSIDLSEYNNKYGHWVFYDNSNDREYESSTIVSNEAQTVHFGIKFIPDDNGFNPIIDTSTIIVDLNDSKIRFNFSDMSFTYTTYPRTFTKEDISKLDSNGNLYESEFDDDKVKIDYLNSSGEYISAPTDVGSYYVVVTVSANRKYKQSETTEQFYITPRNISEVDYKFTDFDSNLNEYQYTTKSIEPTIQLSYGEDKDISSYDKAYENNIEISSEGSKAIIKIKGKGNYTGDKDIKFNIIKRDISTLSIGDISDQYYTGTNIEPNVVMYNNGTLLTDENINITYEDNIESGIATIKVLGIGNYYTGENSITFTIILKELDKELLPMVNNLIKEVYTSLSDIVLESNSYGSWHFVLLETDSDATVGEASPTGTTFDIVFKANGYGDTYSTITIVVVKKTATISINDNLDKEYDTLEIVNPSVTYNGDSEITYTYYQNGKVCSNPKNAGEYKVVVSTKETDTYLSATKEEYFTISKALIGGTNVKYNVLSARYNNGSQVTPEINIYHTNISYTLVEKLDYYVVLGANNTVGKTAGNVYIIAGNNYKTTDAFISETFEIYDDDDPIVDGEGEAVEIDVVYETDYTYTGQEVRPEIVVYINGAIVSTDYYDFEYSDNVNVTENALITIIFKEGYEGTIYRTFKIKEYILKEENVSYEKDSLGNISIVVSANDRQLLLNSDYYIVDNGQTISGNDNYSYIIKGINNYSGEVELTITNQNSIFVINNDIYKFYTYSKSGRNNKWVLNDHKEYNESIDLVLKNVSDMQILSTFLTQFDNNIDFIRVYNSNGKLVSSNKYSKTYVTTAMKIQLVDDAENIIDSFTVVIRGDVDCDGKISQKDKMVCENYLLNVSTISNYQKYAMDINDDTKFSTSDVLFIDSHIYGTEDINKDYLIK